MPCGFMRFHNTTIFCLWNLVRCIQLRYRFHGARMNLLFARHGRCHRPFQISPRILIVFLVFFVICIEKSRFLSVVEHCRVWASRFSILVSIGSERLSQLCSIVQAIRDLVSQSFELLSVFSWTTFIPWEVFLSIE